MLFVPHNSNCVVFYVVQRVSLINSLAIDLRQIPSPLLLSGVSDLLLELIGDCHLATDGKSGAIDLAPLFIFLVMDS